MCVLVAFPFMSHAENGDVAMTDSVMRVDSTAVHVLVERKISHQADSGLMKRKDNPDWWLNRVKARDFSFYDPAILYPRFLRFCMKVYKWGDKTFNTYDPEYVESTGKNWKLMLRSDNWTDSYAMNFHSNIPIHMLSNVYASLGAYLSFMAVSVGYSVNMSKILKQTEGAQKRFDFNFNTALFTIDARYSYNDGGTIIRRFGDYNNGRWTSVNFPDLRLKNYGAAAYYFFNHSRYSQGAVYNFSKYQRRSQGSWILGFSAAHVEVKMDFSNLDESLQQLLPDERRKYNFIYNDFSLMGGYGFNWVFNPRWCFNVTAMPSIGVKHTFAESIEGDNTRFSLGGHGRLGMVYNIRNFFLGINGRIDGHFHINSGFNFINAIVTFGGSAGFRF